MWLTEVIGIPMFQTFSNDTCKTQDISRGQSSVTNQTMGPEHIYNNWDFGFGLVGQAEYGKLPVLIL